MQSHTVCINRGNVGFNLAFFRKPPPTLALQQADAAPFELNATPMSFAEGNLAQCTMHPWFPSVQR